MSEMNNENDLEESIVTLTDDEGNDVEFEFLDLVSYEKKDYVVLLPLESDDDEEDGVLILEVVKGKEETYLDVEDEDILEKVFALFRERYDGDYDFEDGE